MLPPNPMDQSPAPEITSSELLPAGLESLSLPGERWMTTERLGLRYFVSNLGRLMSVSHRGSGKLGLMKPCADANGYLRTMLLLNGRYSTVKMHRLVVETWRGPIAPGLTVNHKNFVRSDNALSNLEVMTLKENVRASSTAGRYGNSFGTINGNSKLTDAKVIEIRKRWKWRKVFQKDLAMEFGVSRMTIKRVLHGKCWKHVA